MRLPALLLSFLGLVSGTLIAAEPYRFEGSSALPLLIIDPGAQAIPNEPKIQATLSVIDHGPGKLNALADTPTQQVPIRIEVRGSSSQMFDKKSYALETVNESGEDQPASLLGLPKETDWILYGPYSDKSLMRNHIAYELSRRMGQYAPRTRFAEAFVREREGDLAEQYVGVYLLVESIKRGKDRVDVPRLRENESGEITGGYVLKVDRVGGPETYFTSDFGTVLGFVSPRGSRLNDPQRAWIQHDFSQFEERLSRRDFRDPQEGYARFIDSDSFIDYFLLNELFKNVDAYFLSTFLHRTGDGRLKLGPVWDLDLSSGNASYGGVWKAEGWMLFPEDPRRGSAVPFWWDRLFEDPAFRTRLRDRYRALRKTVLSEPALYQLIDDTAQTLDAAQKRNFRRWPTLGKYVWPNPRPFARTYSELIQNLKSWFHNRFVWMDANLEILTEKGP
ncbi:MAG TPA: spore coat protein CotH [Planctomycetaceae bacterium]|nr:spore coat protein CotH [Planctomycetaceae bacterium]